MPPMCKEKELEDKEVVVRILAGDTALFRVLLERYERFLSSVVAKYVPSQQIEDVVQDAFISAFKSLKKYSPQAPFPQWLAKIAVRRSYDYWRKQSRRKESFFDDLGEGEVLDYLLSERSQERFEEEERKIAAKKLLASAFSTLSAEDRMVLSLVYFEEQNVKDAAEILGWSVSNVKVRSMRARRKLKRWIEEFTEEVEAKIANEL